MTAQDDGTHKRKPDFQAYNVQTSRDGKGYWNRVGAAWQHKDGKGYEVQLESLPVDGRVTLREMRQEQMQGYQEQQKDPELKQEQAQSLKQSHEQER